MIERIIDSVGKAHKFETIVVAHDDEYLRLTGWKRIIAIVDDNEFFGSDVSATSSIRDRENTLLTQVRWFLGGNHHPTQYDGKFAYLAGTATGELAELR